MTLSSPVIARQLWFTAAQQVEVRKQILPAVGAGELLIKAYCSAVSAGTEMLVYRGQIPADMNLDASLDSLQHQPNFPLQYGYASVGEVQQVGAGVDASWLGKRVFIFQPHESHFIATPANVIVLPEDIAPEDAVFLANMETAVNLIQDGSPALGERVVVLGQGIVGLLLSSLLAQYPLAQLTALDTIATRRARALQLGVKQVANPTSSSEVDALKQQLNLGSHSGADLVYEVSGVPEALNLAIDLSGFASRIVIGSWYGNKSAAIALGGDAHRNRLNIMTSQVSTLAPALGGRWDKARRFELAWAMIRKLRPAQLITHRVPLTDAARLYELLHQQAATHATPDDKESGQDDIVQAIFTYP